MTFNIFECNILHSIPFILSVKNHIKSLKLDNKNRSIIRKKYNFLFYKNDFSKDLYDFLYNLKTYIIINNKKYNLKFFDFKKGYSYDYDEFKTYEDCKNFFLYIIEINDVNQLRTRIKGLCKEFFNKVKGKSTKEKLFRIKNNLEFEIIYCKNCKIKEAKFQNRFNDFTFCSHSCAQKYNETLEKHKKTNLEKYGVEYSFQNEEVKNKIKKTNLDKYGAENVSKNEGIKNKIKETNLKKYGVEYVFQDENVKNKIKKTCIEKYGVDWNSKIHLKNQDKFNKEYIKNNFIKNDFLMFEEMLSFYNMSYSQLHKKLKEWNLDNEKKSSLEYEINKKYFNSLFDINDRNLIKPLEVDFINHKNKLCIEYNGLQFHSYGKTFPNNMNDFDKNYHLNKTLLVEEKGYQLFHIFENEWLDENKRSIWISIINNKLGNSNRIYVRKCIVKEIDTKTSKKFLDENHLQGYVNSKIKLGLFYNNELVSVMTFDKSRYNKKYEYELLRFASLKNYSIIGGASKLLKYFERKYNPKSLISYANRRWSKGNLYEKLGFVFSRNTSPNYFYYKGRTLYSRIKFQKHKLKNILDNFNEDKTELENMIDNNYRIIYDCGNMVFLKNYN